MPPSYKLTYYNSRGFSESIRFLLSYGDIDFEDIRIPFEDWPQFKSHTPFGQLPIFEHNGKVSHQSSAIARYVAKQVKLAGRNDWEDLEIDAVVDTIKDLYMKCFEYYFEKDANVKASMKGPLFNETIPYYLERFNKLVTENKGYLAANRLTWADITLITSLETIEGMTDLELSSKFPNLSFLKAKILEIPNIKSWIEKRPK